MYFTLTSVQMVQLGNWFAHVIKAGIRWHVKIDMKHYFLHDFDMGSLIIRE